LSQTVLVLTTLILMLISFHTMRLGRYFHPDNSFTIPPKMTQEDWKQFFVSSVSQKEQIEEEFWRDVENISGEFPPSRELHLNILLGSESDVVSPETIRMVRQTVMQVREALQALHQFLPVTMSLRFVRNINLQSFLRKSDDKNHSCSTLSATDLVDPPKTSSSFPLSFILSPGVVAADDEFLSCNYQTRLCSPITILIYVPSPQDQPLELVDAIPKSSFTCSHHSNKSVTSHGFIFPSRHLGIIALNDQRATDNLSWKNQNDLATSVIDQFHAFFTGSERSSSIISFDLSTLWARRLLLVRWLSLLYSETLNQLTTIQSLHSPGNPTPLPIETGTYFPLSADKMKIVTEILRRFDFFESCSLEVEDISGTGEQPQLSSFDRQLTCAFEAIVDSNLRARGLLGDPSLIEQRKEGMEMISAILLPFWFPILIPVLYGSFYEVRRYYQKRKAQ
jgi:hypothetical protein